MPAAVQTSLLILAVFFPFYWSNQTYLSKFNWQLVSLLILGFAFHSWRTKKRQKNDPIKQYQSITIIAIVTIVTVILVLTTGGAASPLFWLMDFLLFFVAVFGRAGAAFSLTLALITAFLLNEPELDQRSLINLVSLLLMAPLAAFFSTQYHQVIMTKKENEVLSNQANLLEQSTLIWLALDFRRQMERAVDLVSQISVNLTAIPYHQRDRLNELYRDLKALWQSGQALEKKIDEATE